LIIAYSHCIGQGVNMTTGMSHQKDAVACGYWPLYHFDPREQSRPFSLDSKEPNGAFKEFALSEGRFAMLARSKPEESARLLDLGEQDVLRRYRFYQQLAAADRDAAAEAAGGASRGNGDGADKAKAEEEEVKA
jgi:pyruvate-ferredoxin/flavodoxin oxidoreductase